jgi:hypothetical protein
MEYGFANNKKDATLLRFYSILSMSSKPGCALRGLSLTSMKLLRAFTEHPATIGETYLGHLWQAGSFGLRMMFAGIACVLHGIFPFLFVTTGSDSVKGLHAEMSARRERALRGEVPIR